jgi:Rps23 Pro-64 3,4-dihydroxylase Tpa1-like proline 4-hydroxylase
MNSTLNLNGYTVLSNAVDADQAEKARAAFLEADYDLIKQLRRGHFKRMFPSNESCLPSHEEIYSSEFYRSGYLEKTPLISKIFQDSILPLLKKFSSCELSKFDLRAYKMSEGGHFRLHLDDYTAEIGFIWYLSKEWKWDWGGLLLAIDQEKHARVFLPEWNQLIILEHAAKKIPHCVTRVESHAKESRMMLVGFIS